jgi:hypothetical protein
MEANHSGERHQAPYVVWRRSDGYVGCTRYVPKGYGTCTFDVLLTTDDWPEARALIASEREHSGS